MTRRRQHQLVILGETPGGLMAVADRCTLQAFSAQDAARRYLGLFAADGGGPPVRFTPDELAVIRDMAVELSTDAYVATGANLGAVAAAQRQAQAQMIAIKVTRVTGPPPVCRHCKRPLVYEGTGAGAHPRARGWATVEGVDPEGDSHPWYCAADPGDHKRHEPGEGWA